MFVKKQIISFKWDDIENKFKRNAGLSSSWEGHISEAAELGSWQVIQSVP